MISLKKTGELNPGVFLLLSSDVWHSICWKGFSQILQLQPLSGGLSIDVAGGCVLKVMA